MSINSRQLARALSETLQAHPKKAEKVLEAFMIFCREKHLGNLIPRVARILIGAQQKKSADSKIFVKAHSARSANLVSQVRHLVDAPSQAEVSLEEDSSLLGGFVAFYQGKLYDASVKSQLKKAYQKMINKS